MTTKSSARKPRLPQRKRAKKEELPIFRMTPRDGMVIRAVYECQALTTKQISDLLFVPASVLIPPQPNSRTRHRIKGLYHHGFLFRREQPHTLAEGRKSFLYQVDKMGLEWLAHQEDSGMTALDWSANEPLSSLFLEHLIASNDVRVAIMRSVDRHGFTVEKWLNERTLKQAQNKDVVVLTSAAGKRQNAAVVPDGYFHLNTGTHHYHQVLEIDLATVTGSSKTWTTRTWGRKVLVFLEWYRTGQYHARFHTKSMRVLCVTTGQKRLEHLLAVTQAAGGKSRFWFTTLEKIRTADVLVDPIWKVAGSEHLRSLTW